jgi:hypothetical protein
MARRLVWTERQNFQGYGCSECHWVFEPSSAVFGFGRSLDDVKQAYEAERDKAVPTSVPTFRAKLIRKSRLGSIPRLVSHHTDSSLPCVLESPAIFFEVNPCDSPTRFYLFVLSAICQWRLAA